MGFGWFEAPLLDTDFGHNPVLLALMQWGDHYLADPPGGPMVLERFYKRLMRIEQGGADCFDGHLIFVLLDKGGAGHQAEDEPQGHVDAERDRLAQGAQGLVRQVGPLQFAAGALINTAGSGNDGRRAYRSPMPLLGSKPA